MISKLDICYALKNNNKHNYTKKESKFLVKKLQSTIKKTQP